jgi:hypothetical protein
MKGSSRAVCTHSQVQHRISVLADESTKSLVGRQGVFGGNTQGQDSHCEERRHEGVRVNDIRTVPGTYM